jgi:hypothetical protein
MSRERLRLLVAPGQYTITSEAIYDGLLQRFIVPREANDHVIRCASLGPRGRGALP